MAGQGRFEKRAASGQEATRPLPQVSINVFLLAVAGQLRGTDGRLRHFGFSRCPGAKLS